jgi:hypothetical protein
MSGIRNYLYSILKVVGDLYCVEILIALKAFRHDFVRHASRTGHVTPPFPGHTHDSQRISSL